jgi:hypothetical protein
VCEEGDTNDTVAGSTAGGHALKEIYSLNGTREAGSRAPVPTPPFSVASGIVGGRHKGKRAQSVCWPAAWVAIGTQTHTRPTKGGGHEKPTPSTPTASQVI